MRSFDRSLRAQQRSPLTRDQYLMSVGQMVDFFAAHGMPDEATKVTREYVETFMAEFAEGHAPATVPTRYKCLKLFFAFLWEEGEVTRDPMANMKPPPVAEVPVPVLDVDQLGRCWGPAGGRTSSPGGTMRSSVSFATPACAGVSSPASR
jgi:site-specific recombinase XerC